jgi:hypothetical protein
VAGQTTNPLETTSVSGGADDVFQAITSGIAGPANQPGGANNQPVCVIGGKNVSCFANTNPPSVSPLVVTAATESGTTGSFTVSGGTLQLNVGEFVTLTGFTWSGGNGNGTFAVTGTVGSGCPGTSCTGVSSFQLAGMPSSLGTASTLGQATSQGDTICDNQNFNGTGSPVTGSQLNTFEPALPYSTSCPAGVVWQDLGPQTQRGDMFAVSLNPSN